MRFNSALFATAIYLVGAVCSSAGAKILSPASESSTRENIERVAPFKSAGVSSLRVGITLEQAVKALGREGTRSFQSTDETGTMETYYWFDGNNYVAIVVKDGFVFEVIK